MFACYNLGRMRWSVGKYTNLADSRSIIIILKESPRGRGQASRGILTVSIIFRARLKKTRRAQIGVKKFFIMRSIAQFVDTAPGETMKGPVDVKKIF